jgi:hypothetical protein
MIAHPFPFCGGRYLLNLRGNTLDVFHKYDGSILASIPQATIAEHDLFKQLNGNPHSITMLASCRANPIENFSLKDIYEMKEKV